MKKNLILPLLLALSLPALADPIDDFAQAELERQKIPGLAVGIYRNGNIVKQQGYGLANVEHQIPVSADTVFQTASIGKMFAAAAVMLLVEDGKIRLDQTVAQFLKENGSEVVSFVRSKVGDGIEKKEVDYAAEVAAAAKV